MLVVTLTDFACATLESLVQLVCIRILTPPVHETIYSDHYIWYEKAFPMDLVLK